jgi:hypothetical protein
MSAREVAAFLKAARAEGFKTISFETADGLKIIASDKVDPNGNELDHWIAKHADPAQGN